MTLDRRQRRSFSRANGIDSPGMPHFEQPGVPSALEIVLLPEEPAGFVPDKLRTDPDAGSKPYELGALARRADLVGFDISSLDGNTIIRSNN